MKLFIFGLALLVGCSAFADFEDYTCEQGLKEIPVDIEKFIQSCDVNIKQHFSIVPAVQKIDKANRMLLSGCTPEAKALVEEAHLHLMAFMLDCIEKSSAVISVKLHRMEKKCPKSSQITVENFRKRRKDPSQRVWNFYNVQLKKINDLKAKCEKN